MSDSASTCRYRWHDAFWRYSADFYDDVVTNWKSSGLGAMIALCLVACAVLTVKLTLGYRDFARRELPVLTAQLPTITIEDGALRTPEQKVYEIKGADGQKWLVIDTSVDAADNEKWRRVPCVITKDVLILHKNARETRMYNIDEFQDMEITAQDVEKWAKRLEWLIPLVLLPVTVIGLIIWRMLQVLVFGLYTWLLTAVMKVPLVFGQRFRLTATGLMPYWIIQSVFMLWIINIPFKNWILLALWLGFMAYVVKTLADRRRTAA